MNLESSSILMAGVVDLALSADNAIVIGMAVSGLEAASRAKAIFWGISFAVVLRIGLASGATQLLNLPGVRLVGAGLLAWVCIRLARDLFGQRADIVDPGKSTQSVPSLSRAMTSIVVADVSMSLDNVLAIAAIAEGNLATLVFGLTLSVVLMAIAATALARWTQNQPWIGIVGLLVLAWVSAKLAIGGLANLELFANV